MKRALLIMEENYIELENVTKRAEEYCLEKGIELIGCKQISKKEVVLNPDIIFEEICDLHADIILTQDDIMVFGELSQKKTLLSHIEQEGMGCYDIKRWMSTREVVEKNREKLIFDIMDHEYIIYPTLVLYEGKPGFENDQDFIDIKKFINEEMSTYKFTLLLYLREDDDMVEEFLDVAKQLKPGYIIHNKPFASEKMRLFVDLTENYGISDIEFIDMDEIHQSLEKEHSKNFNLHVMH